MSILAAIPREVIYVVDIVSCTENMQHKMSDLVPAVSHFE